MSISLELRGICRTYVKDNESFLAVDNVNLTVSPGEFLTFLGPSGCGKTTTLRMIAGFEIPSSGQIIVDGSDITQVPANKRDMGFVFQNYALFPHMTIFENVAYGLRIRGLSGDALASKVREGLAMVGLGNAEQRYPNQLSGGEQQRVALARVLVLRPKILLMDEPLSNLDAKLRVEMRSVIRHTQKSVGITTVYVTHDQEEAMAISDRIAVMKDGVIQHVGTPRDIYQRPKNVFVATFIGRTNIVNAHVKDGIIPFPDGYHEHIDALDKAAEQDVRCSIRPEEFIICKDGTDGIHGTVQECTYLGLNTHYTIDTDQGDSVEIVEESSIGEGLKKGEKVARKNWNGKGMFLFLAHSMDITTDADLSCVKDLEGDLVSPSIVMKTADDRFCVGWLASQTDMLADDWYEVQ